MSTCLVTNEVYVKVFNSLVLNSNPSIKMVIERYRIDGVMKEMEKLNEANYKSYDKLYRTETPINKLIIKDEDYTRCTNHCQLLKSLQFIEYQIDLDEIDFDYTFIKYAIKKVETAIIWDLADYQNATWG